MEVMKNVPGKCRERRFHFLRVFIFYGLLPFIAVSVISVLAVSCEELDNDIDRHSAGDSDSLSSVSLGRVASLLAELPFPVQGLSAHIRSGELGHGDRCSQSHNRGFQNIHDQLLVYSDIISHSVHVRKILAEICVRPLVHLDKTVL